MDSRSVLRWKAGFWRTGQRMGMLLHRLAKPTPPIHSLQHSFPAMLSEYPGEITVYLYVPKDYHQSESRKKYPLMVNFHGGGFTLGCGTDDCRWFATVMEETDAIIASVDYRLAPEYPFPTAVDDGADAVLWLVSQAEELGIDLDRGIVLSGFSAGANLAFTVPLKLDSLRQHSWSSEPSNRVDISAKTKSLLDRTHIVGIMSWYPPTNYTLSRPERSATNPKPALGLPTTLTSLFDLSYLYPSGCENDVLLSPALASDEQLARALPRDIWIYTCEFDDLCNEGKTFAERLHLLSDKSESSRDPQNETTEAETTERTSSATMVDTQNRWGRKEVRYEMIPGVTHGWDKMPALSANIVAVESYKGAVESLREVWMA